MALSTWDAGALIAASGATGSAGAMQAAPDAGPPLPSANADAIGPRPNAVVSVGSIAPAACPQSAGITPFGVCEGHLCWDSPAPTGRDLNAVWAASTDDVWFGGDRTLLRWDGRQWTFSHVDGSVISLWGSASDDSWAVDGSGVLHWDGQTWSRALVHANALQVSGSGPRDVWMAAKDALWHWDGTAWSTVATPTLPSPPR